MYDERLDRGVSKNVIARDVLWLGAADGAGVRDRNVVSGRADRIGDPPLLGDTHGPRLLELLNAARG